MTSNLDPDARTSYRLISVAARLVQRRQDDALAHLGLTRAAVIARREEINAYPDDPSIGWKVLSEELAKFVSALPAGRSHEVVPFAPPEHRSARRPQDARGSAFRGMDESGH